MSFAFLVLNVFEGRCSHETSWGNTIRIRDPIDVLGFSRIECF